jgi:TolA-binding protein
MSGTPIEAVKEALEKLEEAQKDLNRARSEIQDLKKKVESLETQLADKADLTTLQDTERTLTQSIQKVEGLANNAQATANTADATANKAVNLANSAQDTANGAVKNIDFYLIEAAVDTRVQSNDVVFNFPDSVDAVVLQTISNDHNQIVRANLSQLNPTSFRVHIDGVKGDGHHWIPGLKFLGIKLRR